MEPASFVFLGLAILIVLYAVVKRKVMNVQDISNNPKQNNILLEAENLRRQRILEKINVLLSQSLFFEPIARWRGDNIYKFVLHNNTLYEFVDIMPEENQRIGIDEEFLCFNRLSYKKIEKSSEELESIKSGQNYNVDLTSLMA